jgi:hypothetical protein
MSYNPNLYVILVKVDKNPREFVYMSECRLREARLYSRRLNARTGLKARILSEDEYDKKQCSGS